MATNHKNKPRSISYEAFTYNKKTRLREPSKTNLRGDYIMRIRKRHGSWGIDISYYGPDGKRHWYSKSGFKTKREAQQAGYKIENQKTDHALTDENPAFATAYLKWYELYYQQNVTKSTQNRYLSIYKHLKAHFGAQKLKSINRAKYQAFMNEYGKVHSKNTVQKTSGTIKHFAQDCIADHLITDDFTNRITLVWDASRTWKVEYLSVAEIKALIKQIEDGLDPRYTSRYMILTAIYTGMRIGEIMALTWANIDFYKNVISVKKSYQYVTGTIKDPKTPSSIRSIRVSKNFLDILNQLRLNQQPYVFANKKGKVPSSNACNKELRLLMDKAGIKKQGFHFHSLRHSHVALLLYEGVPLFAISKRLGHANMSITAQKYAYLIDELKAKSDDKIEEILTNL